MGAGHRDEVIGTVHVPRKRWERPGQVSSGPAPAGVRRANRWEVVVRGVSCPGLCYHNRVTLPGLGGAEVQGQDGKGLNGAQHTAGSWVMLPEGRVLTPPPPPPAPQNLTVSGAFTEGIKGKRGHRVALIQCKRGSSKKGGSGHRHTRRDDPVKTRRAQMSTHEERPRGTPSCPCLHPEHRPPGPGKGNR